MSTPLQLGGITFARFEVPDSIPFGGEQRLNVHELVGGVRVVDSMGATSAPIEWTGTFVGERALDRALELDLLRKSGEAVRLSWDGLAFTVVVKSLACTFVKAHQIPYKVVCDVVADLSGTAASRSAPSITEAVSTDARTATTLAAAIEPTPGPLTTYMGTINTAIAAVSNFATATQATINSVLTPIATARQQAGILLTQANRTIQQVTTLGGILPNNPVARQASAILGQVNAVAQSPNLVNFDRVLGRMQTNIGTINSGVTSIPVAGGDLFTMATKLYGNASSFTALMAANGYDPVIDGLSTIIVPPQNGQTNGVPNV